MGIWPYSPSSDGLNPDIALHYYGMNPGLNPDIALHYYGMDPGLNPDIALHYYGLPTQHTLDHFDMSRLPAAAPTALTSPPFRANPGAPINPVDHTQLISPVINALSTLGTGQFAGMDPTNMLNGISNAFEGTSGPVQQALNAVEQGWQGASHAAAVTKAGAALANSAQVANQASGLSSSLSAAVAEVAQARAQLLEIINEFQSTVAAIGPNIIFPWGWAAVLAAAAKAVTHAAQVMTETQSSLAAHAGSTWAIGKPVPVTSASQLGASSGATSGAGALGSLLGGSSGAGALSSLLGGSSGSASSPMSAMSALSPLMSTAAMPAMMAPSMASSMAGMAGNPATAGAATGSLTGADTVDPKAAAGGAALAGKAGAPVLSAGGGGSAAASGALAARFTAPAAPETAAATISAATARPAAGGMPMSGGGMMGAPVAGHGANAAGAHTAASYLHTSDQGGKVIKDRGTVAPPVIGEADPNDTPDIELRI
jgi:hypothetical protein